MSDEARDISEFWQKRKCRSREDRAPEGLAHEAHSMFQYLKSQGIIPDYKAVREEETEKYLKEWGEKAKAT